MFDRSRSVAGNIRQYDLLASATIAAEGQAIISVASGLGGSVVQPSAGNAGEKFVGFSRLDAIRVSTEVVVERVTVPLAGGTVNLAHANLVASSTNAYNVTDAALMTVVGGAPNTTEVQINTTNGTATFNVAQASDVVQITYRRNLSVEESKMKYKNSLVQNFASDYLHTLPVMGGEGTMYTDQFDSSLANTFAVNTAVRCGAGGLLTTAGSGTIVGYVVQTPGTADSLLGVKYTVSI